MAALSGTRIVAADRHYDYALMAKPREPWRPQNCWGRSVPHLPKSAREAEARLPCGDLPRQNIHGFGPSVQTLPNHDERHDTSGTAPNNDGWLIPHTGIRIPHGYGGTEAFWY